MQSSNSALDEYLEEARLVIKPNSFNCNRCKDCKANTDKQCKHSKGEKRK